MRPGDLLYTTEGRCRRVDAVEVAESAGARVCNLAVRGRHYYAVGGCGALVHNQSWCDILAAKVGKKPQALLDIVHKNNLRPAAIHGHHIVMKTIPSNWGAAARSYVRRAQALLLEYKIPMLFTKDAASAATREDMSNLCYAINGWKCIHSQDYAEAVWDRLRAAQAEGLGAGGWTGAKEAVQEALKEMGSILQKGKSFWG